MAELKVMREEYLPPKPPPRRHLLSIADLTRDDVERLLGTARSFERSMSGVVAGTETMQASLRRKTRAPSKVPRAAWVKTFVSLPFRSASLQPK